MTRRSFAALPLAAALLTLAAIGPTDALAARGPSTKEERDKAVALVEVTEAEPWSDAARDARAWLMSWLRDVPDITAKTCKSLLGPPDVRAAIPRDLQDQILFSGTAFLIQHPGAGAGETPTLLAALHGTLRAYASLRKHGSAAIAPIDELAKLQQNGQLESYVRGQSRLCR